MMAVGIDDDRAGGFVGFTCSAGADGALQWWVHAWDRGRWIDAHEQLVVLALAHGFAPVFAPVIDRELGRVDLDDESRCFGDAIRVASESVGEVHHCVDAPLLMVRRGPLSGLDSRFEEQVPT